MPKTPLAHASLADLRHHAANVLNLSFKSTATAEQLRALISAAVGDQDIDVADEANASLGEITATGKGKVPKADSVLTRTDGRVVIMVPESEEGGAEQQVYLAVNGKNMIVPRGQPVAIPKHYYEVLVNSIRKVPVVNESNQITGWRNVPAYPFSVLPPTTPALVSS